MKFILYRSDSTLANVDIHDLLTSAIKNNAQTHITGFLMSHSSGFIQYFEGEEKAVNDLYAKICADTRHSNVTVLLESAIPERLYSEWDMGHVYIDNHDLIEKLSQSDGLDWFEFLKQRTLFLYPHEFSQQQIS